MTTNQEEKNENAARGDCVIAGHVYRCMCVCLSESCLWMADKEERRGAGGRCGHYS